MQEMTPQQVKELYAKVRDAREIHCCPYCGGGKVKEYRQHSQHCSGLWNTSVQFDCGVQFEFSPNLIRIEQRYMCTKSPDWKARLAKVDSLRAKLVEVAVAEGAHPDDVKKLKEKLEYWNPRYF
uniref:Uncharacterized protein n=1 Tax=Pseudomonas phage HRDY3 TaxID=3236930 RepID=A0AB39CEL3_9VIRU